MRASLAVLTALLSACDIVDGDCTADFRFGLVVQVRDAVTNDPAGQGTIVTARDGSYFEILELFPLDDLTFRGAGERPGVYLIQATKEGYTPWSRTGVRVEDEGCHVKATEVDVRLLPLQSVRTGP